MTILSAILALFGRTWCRRMHRAATCWPHHGHYECRTCQRTYPVPWAGELVAYLVPRETGIQRVQREEAEDVAELRRLYEREERREVHGG